MNNQQLIQKLPVNKTIVFFSPVEGRDVLVRTGTITDSACFFHSLLHASSREYVRMDEKGRVKMVKKLKKSLNDKLSESRWEAASTDLVTQLPFQETVSDILIDFYDYIIDSKPGKTRRGRKVIRKLSKDDDDKSAYQIVCELISSKTLFKDVLPLSYNKCNGKSIKLCKEIITENTVKAGESVLDELGNSIEEKRKQFCLKKIRLMIEAVLDVAEAVARENFSEKLENSTIRVDKHVVDLLSKKLERNIHFIDSRTRMPYRVENINVEYHKAFIVLWLGGDQYEVVGRLLSDQRVQREFYNDDPLINRIRTFLDHPERVAEEYPQLIPYLPDKYRKHRNRSRSRSDSYESSSSPDEEKTFDSDSDSESESESDYSKYTPEARRSGREKLTNRFRNKSHSVSISDSYSESISESPKKQRGISGMLFKTPEKKQSRSRSNHEHKRRSRRSRRRHKQ